MLMLFQEYLGYLVFLPFIGIIILMCIYIYIVVPETKNKTVMEIQAYFAKKSYTTVDNDVKESKDFKPELTKL